LGLLDSILGRTKVKLPAQDRLFAMTTAQVTLETSLDLVHRDVAGIVFQPLATADFEQIVKDTDDLLRSAAKDTGTTVDSKDDEFGYRWIVLHDKDFEDLVVAINVVSSNLESSGYGERLLCAVFAFEEKGRPLYFIYNFKRGAYYPFVPTGDKQRDNERELQLKAQIGGELPFEQELERWFPLWEIPL
jgi:PspA associated protein B